MEIDFTKYIIENKERDTLYKPFPSGSGFAMFAKFNSELVKILFSDRAILEAYMTKLGFDWGPKKDEFVNFDNVARLLKQYPELANAEEAEAADPQWPDKEGQKHEVEYMISWRGRIWKVVGLNSFRSMESNPNAVELREVGHPLHYDDSNYKDAHAAKHYPGKNVPKKEDGSPKKNRKKKETEKGEFRDKNGDLKKTNKANYAALWKKVNEPSVTTSKKKLPPWMDKDKKEDKKGDKKGDKNGDKNGDKKEKGKDGKNLPPWLKKKKSKANYSELHRKVRKTSGDKQK